MKADDPRLEESRKQMFERAEKMDILTLSVLRSHLLVEQCMNDYMRANGVKRKWARKATFAEKMEKCQNISKGEDKADPLWEVLKSANLLRNTIAHSVVADKIDLRMSELKEKYFSSLSKSQMESLSGQPDAYIAQSACVTCAGFIATLTDKPADAAA